MSARHRTLPLGIDLGRRRVRVALTACNGDGCPTLVAVAARDHDGDPVAALADALRELPTAERRCIVGLGHRDATLQLAAFPAMPPAERRRAAQFEAARFIDYPISEATVTVSLLPGDARYVVGVARRRSVAAALATAKDARLRVVAVDDVGLALARVFPDYDGAIDIGDEETQVTLFADPLPYVVRVPIGGEHFTTAIAASLGIPWAAAEERKRTIGFGGAGEAERDRFAQAIGDTLTLARQAGVPEPAAFALCGNGSRIPDLASTVERATACEVRPGMLRADASDALPPDVLRSAGPDWSIAYGLSLWSAA